MAQLAANGYAMSAQPELAAGEVSDGRTARVSPTGGQTRGGGHLRVAGECAHPTVQAAPAGAAGNDDGVEVSSDRSSSVDGFVATVSKACVAWHLRRLHVLTRLLGMLA